MIDTLSSPLCHKATAVTVPGCCSNNKVHKDRRGCCPGFEQPGFSGHRLAACLSTGGPPERQAVGIEQAVGAAHFGVCRPAGNKPSDLQPIACRCQVHKLSRASPKYPAVQQAQLKWRLCRRRLCCHPSPPPLTACASPHSRLFLRQHYRCPTAKESSCMPSRPPARRNWPHQHLPHANSPRACPSAPSSICEPRKPQIVMSNLSNSMGEGGGGEAPPARHRARRRAFPTPPFPFI